VDGLPGADRLSKVGNREALVDRLWSAMEALLDPQPARASKQAEVIALLRRPEGATINEVRAATGWQPHTVARRVLGRAEEEARARRCRDQGGARPGLSHHQADRRVMPVRQSKKARRKTGGPSRCADLALGRARADVEARVIALEALTTADLRIEWNRLFRAIPPTRMSRNLLIRGVVAYRVQERAHGGLSLGAKRRPRSLSETSGQRRGAAVAPAITLKPGAKLVREWHGHVHMVSVLDDGFEYQGERYPSLTRIARRITGVQWSGPVFFGLKRQPSPTKAGDE
jgi:hypothetical protein